MIYLFCSLIFCIFVDLIINKLKPELSFNFRYFCIHFLMSAYFIYLTINDLLLSFDIFTFIDKDNILDNYNLIEVLCGIHIFHIIANYTKLSIIDWLHHIFNIFLCSIFCINYIYHKVTNLFIFFLMGFPGIIEYLLLILSKLDFIESIIVKKIHSYLYIYIRLPGVLWSIMILYLLIINQYTISFAIIGYITILIMYLNISYYAHNIAVNYGKKLK